MNTTPVGMYPGNGAAPVDLTAFPACRGVLDVIYNPLRTALLLQAEALGIPCSDGLPMLVAQAMAAEEHFFGTAIPDRENERILAQLRQEMTNIVLIGMPGSGKTTVGRLAGPKTGPGGRGSTWTSGSPPGRLLHPEIFARGGKRNSGPGAGGDRGRLVPSGVILLTGGGVVKTRKTMRPPSERPHLPPAPRISACCPLTGRPCPRGRTLPPCGRGGSPCTGVSGTRRLTTTARWRTPPPSGGIFVHILVINGPNMNMLGIRQPEIYGHETYEDLKAMIQAEADRLGASRSPSSSPTMRGPGGRHPAGLLRPCGRHHHQSRRPTPTPAWLCWTREVHPTVRSKLPTQT